MHPLNVRRAVAAALFISVVVIGSYITVSRPPLFVVAEMVVATAVPTLLLVLIIIRTNRGLRGPDGH